MNIGSLFKSMIGDAKPGEAKQVDLRAGQVVRGVVQSVSEDGKEAVVQIQGVKVNAKLETPLQAGQTAFMEVQPAAEDGSIVMKPVAAPPGAAAGAQSMEDTLKQLGMPDNKQNREMVRMMQQAEIPMTKENAAEVRNMLAQKPASVDAQQWVRSIGILQQRGLPITPQSVSGMQQAVFGAPASAVLQNLGQQVAAALAQLGEGAGEGTALPGRGLSAPQLGAASGQAATGTAGALPTNGQNVSGNAATGNANPISAAAAGLTTNATSPEDGNPAQIRNATQAAAGATSAAGDSAAPEAAQTTGAAKAAERTTSAATGVNQTPTGNTAQQALQGQGSTAAQAEATGRNAGASELPQTDAALLRKIQTLLGELRTAAAGSTENANAAAARNGQTTAQADAADAGPWVGRLLKMLGAEHEQQTARSTLLNTPTSIPTQAAANSTPLPQSAPPASPSPAAAQTAAQLAQTSAAQTQQGAAANAASAAAAAATNAEVRPEDSAAVRNAADQALRAVQGEAMRTDGAATADNRAAAQTPAAQQSVAEVRETLKSLLLQLSASDSLPAGLKDAAQQAVQQMTGQQLLLNTDRTAPFAQVTMFLPFVGPDGNQTASVQIESRRGPKGELDASNCRLWFDLDMKSLGRTLIDVQVADRKVSLNFRNDEDWARPLLEAGQPQIASAFEAAGYQLLALRTDALPERSMESNGESGTSLSYAPPAYRGVDVKI
ncbi:flagellar hook-length control protein FliK [Saccharibacillus sacchari]|uniref:Flagellar hook-length control protein FliK n=1 Tax=Saccharibacillus sacchari DSM 19268 TaxID=915437 RepID=A0A010ZWW3_9BACL|nr:flagellar hook-length control protein FliK [Saccharibacillus sacchari]EXG83154.1 hypothetical protein SacsacDRAFT_0119 [Saccharibacillus sacchari DSM 19268]